MSELRRYINECPLYRQAFSQAHIRRPAVLYCTEKEAKAAKHWYIGITGRQPLNVEFFDQSNPVNDRVSRLSVWETRPEVLLIVYGKYGRRKGLDISQAGIRNFVFHEDQNYKPTRFDPYFLKTFEPRLEALFDLLEDDESRWTLASVVKQRITGEHGYLRIATYQEYEHPEVSAEAGETVYDVGSFDGATSFRFADKVGPKGLVYAFEPDPGNAERINKAFAARASNVSTAQVNVVQKAASNTIGKLKFAAGESGSSRLTDDGGIEVDSVTLDAFSAEAPNARPHLISLDVEGAEPFVLEGCRELIETSAPKLQISSYHTMEHLVSLAEFVAATRRYKRFFLGHHNTYSTETDLYVSA